MKGKEAAKLLELIANILEFKGENPFKVRAYRNAAHFIEGIDDLETFVKSGKAKKVKGIGPAIEAKLHELVETGTISYLDEIKKDVPESLLELFEVPGLGPKRLRVLYDRLGIKDLSELEYACLENRLLTIPGFGKKSQDRILKGIELLKKRRENFLLSESLEAWESLRKRLESGGVKAYPTGKLRRVSETLSSLSFVILRTDLRKLPPELHVERSEEDRIYGKDLETGIPFVAFGTAEENLISTLFVTTGSEKHLSLLKELMDKKALSIEGLNILKRGLPARFRDEGEIYGELGLPFIPPEIREGEGEIEAALEGKVPKLVELKDLKGIIHVHTIYSDGRNTIEELCREVMRMGFSYIGISDHSKSAHYANGLKEDDIKRQHEEIDALNEVFEKKGFKIFKGIESDILPDGSLDYSEKVLESFDFVIASVHSRFNMSKEEMTRRIIKALENPYTTILGHPTGRLLLGREPYSLDLEEVLSAAKQFKKAIELNAHPMRLDLSWRYLKRAKSMGIKISIGPDAHSISDLYHVKYGVMIARKGWIEKRDLFTLDEGKGP